MRILVALGGLALIFLLIVSQTAFKVDQTQFVVVTRFGEIQHAIASPGLAFKVPFVDQVNRFDKRLLHIDVPSATMPDRDKQNLEIDAYARYRIDDPVKFIRRLRDEDTAGARIGNIVIAAIRAEVAKSSRSDIIGAEVVTIGDGSEGLASTDSRANMLRQALVASDRDVKDPANDFGVTVVDVRIKAADFPEATQQSIFNRMSSERDVQAQRLRAEGEEESLTIRADVDRQRAIILANAERDANRLRGQGEAEAIRILADALEGDPEFFAFRRSLQTLEVIFREGTTVVLPAESDLFQYLQSPNPPSE